jgi:hypothetical protein
MEHKKILNRLLVVLTKLSSITLNTKAFNIAERDMAGTFILNLKHCSSLQKYSISKTTIINAIDEAESFVNKLLRVEV